MAGRGFAEMDPGKRRAISSAGGKAAHAAGTAHQFSSSLAESAGRKGGLVRQARLRELRAEQQSKELSRLADGSGDDDGPATERAPRTMPPVIIVEDGP